MCDWIIAAQYAWRYCKLYPPSHPLCSMCFDDPVTQCGHSNWTNKSCFTLGSKVRMWDITTSWWAAVICFVFIFAIFRLWCCCCLQPTIWCPLFSFLSKPNMLQSEPIICLWFTSQPIRRYSWFALNQSEEMELLMSSSHLPICLNLSPYLFSIPGCILCIDDRQPRTMACLLWGITGASGPCFIC